jgi:nicotinamidase-related amidase
MERPALLVIDMLNDFLDRWELLRRDALIRSINELVRMMREASLPVIWVRQEFEADLSDAYLEMRRNGIRTAIKGTSGAQIDAKLDVVSSDRIVIKKRYSAFFGTPLDAMLAGLKPDGLIVAGINTHACIRTTVIDAYQRDWELILATDCVDSYDSEHHRVTMSYLANKIAAPMTNRQIRELLTSR